MRLDYRCIADSMAGCGSKLFGNNGRGIVPVAGFAGAFFLFCFCREAQGIHVPAGVYVLPSAILVTGIVVLFNPFQAATVPFIVLGAASVVYALTDLFRLLRFRRKRNGQIEDITPIEETKEE